MKWSFIYYFTEGERGESIFSTWKAFYLDNKYCLKVYIKILEVLSLFWVYEAAHIPYPNQHLNFIKKYFWSTIGKKVLNHLIQLKYYNYLAIQFVQAINLMIFNICYKWVFFKIWVCCKYIFPRFWNRMYYLAIYKM